MFEYVEEVYVVVYVELYGVVELYVVVFEQFGQYLVGDCCVDLVFDVIIDDGYFGVGEFFGLYWVGGDEYWQCVDECYFGVDSILGVEFVGFF